MKVRLLKPIRVNCQPCEVEVSEEEYIRLRLLNAAEAVISKETTKVKKETKVVKE